ncbi:hypothetical protein ACQ4PT_001743 [Festuca glaucescens]
MGTARPGLPRLMAVTFALVALFGVGVHGRNHIHKKPHGGGGAGHRGGAKGGSTVVSSPAVPPDDDATPLVAPPPPPPSGSIVPSDPATPVQPAEQCVFDVREYGATGENTADDTEAFRAAWSAACAVESAVLLVPSDGTFTISSTTCSGRASPVSCSSGELANADRRAMVVQVDGVLMPPDGPDCWPPSDNRRQWLVFSNLDGMTLRGAGTIEGNGEDWWNLPCKPHRGPNGSTLHGPCDSPTLIRFFMSCNLVVQGLRVENSPEFHFRFDGCSDVLVDGLFIRSPANSPNTDGIHVENTERVGIYNSKISNGDDCISIGTGSYDVDIQNVTCGPGHGI